LTAPGSAEHNFRYTIATDKIKYKGTRKEKAKHFAELFSYAVEYVPNIMPLKLISGKEADDYLVQMHSKSVNTVLASNDKDMFQSPGVHFYIKDHAVKYLTEADSARHFGMQLIAGDTVDNVPGLIKWLKLYGYTNVANKLIKGHYKRHYEEILKILDTPKAVWYYVRALYLLTGLNIYDTLYNTGHLVYLLRDDEDSFTKYVKTLEE